MNIETPPELAEHIADLLRRYGDCPCGCDITATKVEHHELHHSDHAPCGCRICFTTDLTRRIRESVENEHMIGLHGEFLEFLRKRQ